MSDNRLHAADPLRFWGVGEVVKLALPTFLGMVNFVAMQFVDGLMISRISPGGTDALAAQSTAGIIAFATSAFMVGALTVVNTYVSQNLGAGHPRKCSQYAWQGLYLAVGVAAMLLPVALLSGRIFALFPHEPHIQAMEAMYYSYMVSGAVFFLGAHVLQQFFYGIERPGIVYIASIAANAVNLLLDYGLIFGKLGMPRLGLEGAAIATLIGAATSMVVLAWAFFRGSMHRQYGTRSQFRLRAAQMRELLKIGWPAGAQMFLDVLGWSAVIAVLIGGIPTIRGVVDEQAPTIHLAASSVAMRYMPLSFMPAVGIGIAATALVGRYIGERRVDLARRRAYAALGLAIVYMFLCGIAFAVWRYPLVEFFIATDPSLAAEAQGRLRDIIDIGAVVLILAALFQVFDAVGIVIVSALRGAGDTLWPMVVSVLLNATLLVGGGWAMLRLLPSLESIAVWIAAGVYVAVLGIVMLWRFHTGGWQKIDLLHEAQPQPDKTGKPVEDVIGEA